MQVPVLIIRLSMNIGLGGQNVGEDVLYSMAVYTASGVIAVLNSTKSTTLPSSYISCLAEPHGIE